MTEPSSPFPSRFAFTYTDDEIKAYSRLVAARQDRGPDGSSFFAAMIGLVVGLARQQGLISPSALKPVLISTYASFILGAATYAFAIRLGYRRIMRRYRAYTGAQSYEISFDADGIRRKDRRYDAYAPWQ